MALDNRSANRKSNSHTIGLGCVERLERLGSNLRLDTNSRVFQSDHVGTMASDDVCVVS